MHRPIRSFVLRQGRLSTGQSRAVENIGPRLIIPYSPTVLDYENVFGRAAPTIVEIGFGMGHTTADIAASLPDKNFIGIEVHTPGVGSLLKMADERTLDNLRIVQHDAVEVLQHMIADNSLAGTYFFPRPLAQKTSSQTTFDSGGLCEFVDAKTDAHWHYPSRHRLARVCGSDAGRVERIARPGQYCRRLRAKTHLSNGIQFRAQRTREGTWCVGSGFSALRILRG